VAFALSFSSIPLLHALFCFTGDGDDDGDGDVNSDKQAMKWDDMDLCGMDGRMAFSEYGFPSVTGG